MQLQAGTWILAQQLPPHALRLAQIQSVFRDSLGAFHLRLCSYNPEAIMHVAVDGIDVPHVPIVTLETAVGQMCTVPLDSTAITVLMYSEHNGEVRFVEQA